MFNKIAAKLAILSTAASLLAVALLFGLNQPAMQARRYRRAHLQAAICP